MEAQIDRNVSVQVLRYKTKSLLSAALNPMKVIPTDVGTRRCWIGLATLCDINSAYIGTIAENNDPTTRILELWQEQDATNSTIQNLLMFLEQMDRFDVIDDLITLIDGDVKYYKENPTPIRPNLKIDKSILVQDDVLKIENGQPLDIYDAFVLYDQDDIDFATKLIDEMENTQGMKFVTRDRDLVVGGIEMMQMVELISNRCNRIITILSDAFFKSTANKYYLSFAHSYGMESQRKIIPVMYKDCTLPPDMQIIFKMDYRRAAQYNFWEKLKMSLVVPKEETQKVTKSRSDHALRSAWHNSSATSVRTHQEVKFSSSVENLNAIPNPPLLTDTSPSLDNESIGGGVEKKKKPWYNVFSIKRQTKKPQSEIPNPSKNKKKTFSMKQIRRKMVAVAN